MQAKAQKEGGGGRAGAGEREKVVSQHMCEMVGVWPNELRSAALATNTPIRPVSAL